MKRNIIIKIEELMADTLSNIQMEKLHNILVSEFQKIKNVGEEIEEELYNNNDKYIDMFLAAKQVEGCSVRTLKYYKSSIIKILGVINKKIKDITTEDLRKYLCDYEKESNCSKATLDNIRRILSSFFSWLEDEDYILKSPVRRIHKVKAPKKVKPVYSDESLEIMRDGCKEIRDLAIIDILASTGMRVGELVNLNIRDINFNERSCVVLGKGNKQREVYFDARTKIHLQNYLNSRKDDNPALFVSLLKPNNRLEISGVEVRLRKIGRALNLDRVHPHKFRRTMATRAIDKGMPVEQVQRLLGHEKIDTTLQYAMVNQNNVKNSHRKFIS